MYDAAKYLEAAGAILKSLYPKLFHVTCVAHLFHNCATKVKSHCEDVDRLISKAKSATVDNKTGQAKFATIGCPLRPIVTRWGCWLNAVFYYAKNLPEVRAIVESFEESDSLATQ